MATPIQPKEFRGLSVNSAAIASWLDVGDGPLSRDVTPVVSQPPNKPATLIYVRPEPSQITLHLVLTDSGTALQVQRDAVIKAFAKGAEGELIVDFDGTRRKVPCVVQRIVPYERANTLSVVLYAADPRWLSEFAITTGVLAMGVNPFNTSQTNAGSAAEDGLIIAFTPSSMKAAAATYTNARDCIVVNRSDGVMKGFALDVTGTGGFDHLAEVGAGNSLASGNDVRVLIDGVETDRWPGAGATTAFNQADTQLWVNLDLSPALKATLEVATTAVVPANGGTLTVKKGTTAGWPDKGYILADDEVLRYDGKTETSFLNIQRAQRTTTAAIHATALVLYRVERRVQIIYRWSAAPAPPTNDHLKPLIDLATSSNGKHVWSAQFAHLTDPRSMQWTLATEDRDAASANISANMGTAGAVIPAMQSRYYVRPSATPYKPGNVWFREFPIPVSHLKYAWVSTAATMALQGLGIDSQGKERFVSGGNDGVTVDVDVDNFRRVMFNGRSYIVGENPLTGVQDIVTGIGTAPVEYLEPITMPPKLFPKSYIAAVYLDVYKNTAAGTNPTARLTLAIEDPLVPGTYVDITAPVDVVLTSTTSTYASMKFAFTAPAFPNLPEGTQVFLRLVRAAGTGTIAWAGVKALTPTRTTVRSYQLMSIDHDIPDGVTGADDTYSSVTSVEATHLSTQTPYVALKGAVNIYHLNGTLTNSTTGQVITLSVFMPLGDTLTIDVGARSAKLLASGDDASYGLSFSDPDNWLTLVPGSNAFVYAESGIVNVGLTLTWSNTWD